MNYLFGSKKFKKRYLILLLLCSTTTNYVLAAQQPLNAVPKSTASNAITVIRDGVNTELAKQQTMNTELYAADTLKANISCFTSEAAFNACFALDWSAGSVSSWADVQALITGSGDYIKYDGTRGNPLGSIDLSAYLSKTNTTAFTPSGDYHPATKKYVDDSITAGGGYTDEQAQDAVGGMFTGNTETNITVTYDDTTGKINLAVPTIPTISDAAYGSGWNGDTGAASKNAIYDKIETLSGSSSPDWLPSTGPTDGRQILQATGGCTLSVYDNQADCETNSGTWTTPSYQHTSIISGLINDTGTTDDDLWSAAKIISELAGKQASLGFTPQSATSLQMTFVSDDSLEIQTGSKTKVPTGVDFTTADIGCDVSDSITFTLRKSSTVNGTYSTVGTISVSAAAQNESIDISSWANLTAGDWVRIDLTTAGTTAKECTVVIGGTEL